MKKEMTEHEKLQRKLLLQLESKRDSYASDDSVGGIVLLVCLFLVYKFLSQ